MKKCNKILTEKEQKYHYYHQVQLINMNILQVKKYYLLLKKDGQNTLSLHNKKTIEDQRRKQIDAIMYQNERLAA